MRRRSASVTLCRELTKQFETIVTLPAAELPAWLAADDEPRARRVRAGAARAPVGGRSRLPAAALHALRVLLRELPLKQAVALAVPS